LCSSKVLNGISFFRFNSVGITIHLFVALVLTRSPSFSGFPTIQHPLLQFGTHFHAVAAMPLSRMAIQLGHDPEVDMQQSGIRRDGSM
jgi:hypothetical protein